MTLSLTSLDIYLLIKDLKSIEKSRIDKIYCSKESIVISLYVGGKGKQYLHINFPSMLFLSPRKGLKSEDTGLSKVLRKYLTNKRIISLEQYEFERIIVIKTPEAKVVIELFDKGNLLLLKEDDTIISAYKYKKYRERTIRGGIKYEFPKNRINPVNVSAEELSKIIISKKQSVVKTLARELSLGGLYAEELCHIAKIDKKSETLHDKDVKKVHKALISIFSKKINIYTYKNKLSLIELASRENPEEYDSFDELISKYEEENRVEVIPPKIQKIQKIIQKQKESLEYSIKEQDETNYKGSKIYEHYSEIDKLLKLIRTTKTKKGWEEVVSIMPKNTKINPKTGKIKIKLK